MSRDVQGLLGGVDPETLRKLLSMCTTNQEQPAQAFTQQAMEVPKSVPNPDASLWTQLLAACSSNGGQPGPNTGMQPTMGQHSSAPEGQIPLADNAGGTRNGGQQMDALQMLLLLERQQTQHTPPQLSGGLPSQMAPHPHNPQVGHGLPTSQAASMASFQPPTAAPPSSHHFGSQQSNMFAQQQPVPDSQAMVQMLLHAIQQQHQTPPKQPIAQHSTPSPQAGQSQQMQQQMHFSGQYPATGGLAATPPPLSQLTPDMLQQVLNSINRGAVLKDQVRSGDPLKMPAVAPKAGPQVAGNAWTTDDQCTLLKLVACVQPQTPKDWELIATAMGRWSEDSSVAPTSPNPSKVELMYATPSPVESAGSPAKQGRRVNSRAAVPMYIKAVYALLQLPNHEGNLTQISDIVARHAEFARELDWTPRPGAKTYPRWKDALLSCFKEGRYPYLQKTNKKSVGSTVYRLDTTALRAEDIQKYMCYLELPMEKLGLLTAGLLRAANMAQQDTAEGADDMEA